MEGFLMPVAVAYVIGAILAIGGTIVSYIFIIPAKKRNGLNKFLRFLHDVFNFKSLLLEQIIRGMYVLTTIFVITTGFFMLFSVQRTLFGSNTTSTAPMGAVMMLVGPFFVRLVYEGIMMFILLVKNTIEINNKIPYNGNAPAAQPARPVQPAPVQQPAPPPPAPVQQPTPPPPAPVAEKMVYCSVCGTRYDANASQKCPNNCVPPE
jgi:hypothetical protein